MCTTIDFVDLLRFLEMRSMSRSVSRKISRGLGGLIDWNPGYPNVVAVRALDDVHTRRNELKQPREAVCTVHVEGSPIIQQRTTGPYTGWFWTRQPWCKPIVGTKPPEECWLDAEGRFHRLDGPAALVLGGGEQWFQHGVLHRVGGPAVTMEGFERYFVDGIEVSKQGHVVIESYAPEERENALGYVCIVEEKRKQDERDKVDILAGLAGREVDFYGICYNSFKIGLDDGSTLVLEAVEDPDDGYRSMLGCIVTDPFAEQGIYFQQPIARVRIVRVEDPCFEGYRLLDVQNSHVWLQIGTDHSDYYYPSFTFRYTPREAIGFGLHEGNQCDE